MAVGYKSWNVKFTQNGMTYYINNLRMPDAQAIAFCMQSSSIEAKAIADYSENKKTYRGNQKS